MDFVAANGTNHVRKWYGKELSITEQATLDALLDALEKTAHWKFPEYKTLSGKHLKGLGEIRFSGDQRRQVRVIGCQWKETNFVLLLGCMHKGSVYEPASALDTAALRKKDLEHSRGSICEHEIDGEDEAEVDRETEEG
ncbi:MAG: hypothetical protein JST77_18050 [Acidobacteria bacterium]|nr:hypothetical protein [Acidobacteriota bacterium]